MAKFKVDPKASLQDAIDADLVKVAIVGIARNGTVMVWGSDDGETTLDLFRRAPERIEELSAPA